MSALPNRPQVSTLSTPFMADTRSPLPAALNKSVIWNNNKVPGTVSDNNKTQFNALAAT